MLVFMAMLIKFAASTACLLDGPGDIAPAVQASHAGELASAAAAPADSTPGDPCLLGESGGCHCTCAHAVAMPAASLSVAAVEMLRRIDPPLAIAPSARPWVSPLRPPIA